MTHPCINHDNKHPNNAMHCEGQLCSDCPFREKFKMIKEEMRRGLKNE